MKTRFSFLSYNFARSGSALLLATTLAACTGPSTTSATQSRETKEPTAPGKTLPAEPSLPVSEDILITAPKDIPASPKTEIGSAERSAERTEAESDAVAITNFMAESAQLRRQTSGLPAADSHSLIGKTARMKPAHGFHLPPQPIYHPQPDRERYPDANENRVQQVASSPVSTFSIDVDTAAYANARRMLNAGRLPNADAVRVEEFINYFNYSYPQPDDRGAPFSITTEVGPSPWNSDRKLMMVGLQGYDTDRSELPPANLVFLIDVSGSMRSPQKLGLLKSSMKMLTKQLRPQDTLSIAVYAGAAGQVLEPTSGRERSKIMAAIDSLQAGGSTNGEAGIHLAYKLAKQDFKNNGINRVILATDGDFNVGTHSTDALGELIEDKRKSGVSLTVLGFGTGNYNDALMQELAQKGNGNAAYIDTMNEARKVLVDEMGSTLETIAKDVKIQVEFNPDVVREYRLIGYETRHLEREDFNNDKIDAGEIGAGHSVTALYELTLADASQPSVDGLRYGRNHADYQPGTNTKRRHGNLTGELAHVKLRYKAPSGDTSKLIERVVKTQRIQQRLAATSDNYRFAVAAGAFAQLLRGSDYTGEMNFDDVLQIARKARGNDQFGYRHEFENLLRTASAIAPQPGNSPADRQSDDPKEGIDALSMR